MTKFIKIGRAEDIAPGEKRVYEVDGFGIVVANLHGNFYAVDDLCTHDGGPLGEGDLENGHIICPRHGARFDLRTGAALTMPAFEPIATYVVKVENGDLLIESF